MHCHACLLSAVFHFQGTAAWRQQNTRLLFPHLPLAVPMGAGITANTMATLSLGTDHPLVPLRHTSTMDSQTSFTDVPLAWLAQLISDHLDIQSRQAMFQTCRAFRRSILAGSGRVQCELSTDTNADEIARSLQLLAECKKGADVELVMQAEALQSHLSSCFHGSAYLFQDGIVFRLPSSQLHAITRIEVKGVLSGHLVPTQLCEHCPNMRQFKRTGIFEHGLDPQDPPALCPQLQELILVNLALPGKRNYWSSHQMAEQLRSLPGLQCFECVHERNSDGGEEFFHRAMAGEWTSWLLNSLACLGPQLKSLRIPYTLLPSTADLWALSWPNLHTLHLMELDANTQDFRLLLESAPQLRDLRVKGAWPNADLSHRACNWEQLTITGVITPWTLSQLPISGLQDLSFGWLEIYADDLPYLHEATQALSKVRLFRALDDADELPLHILCSDEPAVMAAAPMLQLFPQTTLTITGRRKAIGSHWLDVLAQLSFTKLSICPRMLDGVSLAALPQRFQAMQHLHVFLYEGRSVLSRRRVQQLCNQLCMLCALAPRALTLELSSDISSQLGSRWVNEAVLGMQSAGHQRVQFDLWETEGGDDAVSLGTSDEEAFDAAEDEGGDENDDNDADGDWPGNGVVAPAMAMPGFIVQAPVIIAADYVAAPADVDLGPLAVDVAEYVLAAPAIGGGNHIAGVGMPEHVVGAPAINMAEYDVGDPAVDVAGYEYALGAPAVGMANAVLGAPSIGRVELELGAPAIDMEGYIVNAPAYGITLNAISAPPVYRAGYIQVPGMHWENNAIGAPAMGLAGNVVGAHAVLVHQQRDYHLWR